MPDILQIALPTVLRRTFDYLAPSSTSTFQVGCRVLVPFGQQKLVGIVVGHSNDSAVSSDKLRPIDEQIDQEPIFSDDILQLCQWVSNYYQHPLGLVLHAALPVQLRKAEPLPEIKGLLSWRHTHEGKGLPKTALRGAKQQQIHQILLLEKVIHHHQLSQFDLSVTALRALEKKGLIESFEQAETVVHTPATNVHIETPLTLNHEQQAALKAIRFHDFATYLLDGSTGSGKTEIYLQAIARTLNAGKQALLLVPEIGLTPQTLERFERRFNAPIVQLHSNVSLQQRTANWMSAASGRARIVIGTRLAIFTPMPDLGLIILDEEHDLSFKQQDGLRYSARDVAVMRAFRNKIPLLLGSATPALETLNNAQQGRYHHLRLTERAGNAQAPEVHCIDMRKEPAGSVLSAAATATLARALARGEQALVFINRRGYAPALLCPNCGWSAMCRNCDARMTLHNYPRHMHCHHCDQQGPVPHRCPSCHNTDLHSQGQGTERCELVLQSAFPAHKVIRVDQDSMQNKNAMAELNTHMQRGEPCILVGTQMLAKGHHFPKVTVVILLDIDQGLFSGDFRGPERMGQLITQVSGRAGRAQWPGIVLLQTYQPLHPLLQCLLQQGYHAFANEILRERELTCLPPFFYMAVFRAESKRANNAKDFLTLAAQIAKVMQPSSPLHRYLGPIPALLEKRNERFRFQFQLCFQKRGDLQKLLPKLISELEQHALSSRTRWSVDVDPQDMS